MKNILKFAGVLVFIIFLGFAAKAVYNTENDTDFTTSEKETELIKNNQANRYSIWGTLKKGCKSKQNWTCDLR